MTDLGSMFAGRERAPGGLRSRSTGELRRMLLEARRDVVQAKKDAGSPYFREYQRASLWRFIDQQERLIRGIEMALRARGEM